MGIEGRGKRSGCRPCFCQYGASAKPDIVLPTEVVSRRFSCDTIGREIPLLSITLAESGGSGKRLEFFPWLEADGLAGKDIDLGSGARVSSNSRFPGLYVKNPESPQFYPLSFGQGLLHRLEYSLNGNLCFGLRNAGTVDDIVDKIELNQRNLLKTQDFIVKSPFAIVKLFSPVL